MLRALRKTSRQRGMTLTEVLVALLLLSVLFVAFLAVFDASNRLAKSQGNISDATENLRYSVASLVRLLRMAGTGGLPIVFPSNVPVPPALATLSPLAVDGFDNVAAGAQTFGGKTALAGTDVLRVRGVILGELYDIQGAVALATPNQLVIPETSPWTQLTQELRAPTTATGLPMIIGLQVPLDIIPNIGGVREYSNYRVVTVSAEPVIGGGTMTITYDENSTHAGLNPNGGWSGLPFTQALSAGFIDDFVFFVANNSVGEPALYRFDGTGNAVEMVPNIANLQVAWGIDLNRDRAVTDVGSSAGDDEWFLNVAGESMPTGDQLAALRGIRVSVVARSQDPEMGWTETIGMPENGAALSGGELRYKYRALAVQVLLRSHPPLI